MRKIIVLFSFLFLFSIPKWGGAIQFHLIQSMSDEEYQSQMSSCKMEVEHLEDQVHEAWSQFRDATQSEYDLRREQTLCWNESELLRLDLEECRAASGENENNSGAFATEEGTEPGNSSTERSNGPINYRFMIQIVDLAKNGTCEKPKTNSKKEKCLSECQINLSSWREELEYAQERISDPAGTLRGEIQYCHNNNQELQTELDACRSGESSADNTGTVIHIDTSGTVRVPPIHPRTGGGSGNPPSNPTPGCGDVKCRGK